MPTEAELTTIARITTLVVNSAGDDHAWLLDTTAHISMWLARGDGVAVYENMHLGHNDLGRRKFLSFGSPEAQIEDEIPPNRLPDIGGEIGWRYVLVTYYRET